MYTPMKFVDQTESMIITPSDKSREGVANRLHKSFVIDHIERNRDLWVGNYIAGYVTEHPKTSVFDVEKYNTLIQEDMRRYMLKTDLCVLSKEDYCHAALMTTMAYEWSRIKKVFLLEKEMGNTLYNMDPPDEFLMEPFLKLPAKCFYIDYRESGIFGNDIVGTMVTTSKLDGYAVFHFFHFIDRDRVMPICQSMAFGLDGGKLTVNKSEDTFPCEIEDGTTVQWSDNAFIKFFANFCLYLAASNNDVEYTERTKTVYKPRQSGQEPKNKMREVEEFGVGFTYAKEFSKSSKRIIVKSGANKNESGKKRAYSSCYRNAHWQHYWVNDPEAESGKKRIIKWIEGVFVKGNTESKNVSVHVVKE